MELISKVKDRLSGKYKEKLGGRPQGGAPSSSPQATSPQTPASDPGPAKISSVTAITTRPSVPQPVNTFPASAPITQSSAQPTTSDTVSSALPSNNDIAVQDPWIRAYEIVQKREVDLMTDYKKHLASLQDDVALSADLSTPGSVESIVGRSGEEAVASLASGEGY
jgi:hypothetical protein